MRNSWKSILILALTLVACNQSPTVDLSQKTPEQQIFEQAWAQRQLEANPRWKTILNFYGKTSILELDADTAYTLKSDGSVTARSLKSADPQPQFSGFFTARAKISGATQYDINGDGYSSVNCIFSPSTASLDLEMVGPRGQSSRISGFGTGNLNANVSRNLQLINSGIGTYWIYGTHDFRCGGEFTTVYTSNSFYQPTTPA